MNTNSTTPAASASRRIVRGWAAACDASGKSRWQLRRDVPYVTCLVQHGGHVFYVADKGVASCLDLATGKEIQRVKLDGPVTGSPAVGRVVEAQDREGRVLGRHEGPREPRRARRPRGSARGTRPGNRPWARAGQPKAADHRDTP